MGRKSKKLSEKKYDELSAFQKKIVDAVKNDKLNTDSDIYYFAKDNHLSERKIRTFMANLNMMGTRCEGCTHVENRLYNDIGSCRGCSRAYEDLKDLYEPESKAYET